MRRVFTSFAAFVSAVGITLTVVAAQDYEKPAKMKDLPPAVQKTVEEQRKSGVLRGLAKEVEDGKTFYEASIKVNGHNRDVLIDSTGTVVEVEEEVPFAALPQAVKDTIQKLAGRGKIVLVESITKNNALFAYEAHIKTGRKSSEIKVAPDGQLLGEEK